MSRLFLCLAVLIIACGYSVNGLWQQLHHDEFRSNSFETNAKHQDWTSNKISMDATGQPAIDSQNNLAYLPFSNTNSMVCFLMINLLTGASSVIESNVGGNVVPTFSGSVIDGSGVFYSYFTVENFKGTTTSYVYIAKIENDNRAIYGVDTFAFHEVWSNKFDFLSGELLLVTSQVSGFSNDVIYSDTLKINVRNGFSYPYPGKKPTIMEGHYTFMNNPEFLAFSEFSNVTFVNHLTGQQKSVTVPDLTCDTPIYIESIPDFGLKSFPEMYNSFMSLDNVMKTDYPGVSNLANYKKLISLVKDGYIITDYSGIVISKISSNILSKECVVLTGSNGRIYSFCFNDNYLIAESKLIPNLK